jgi:hypothetical protein
MEYIHILLLKKNKKKQPNAIPCDVYNLSISKDNTFSSITTQGNPTGSGPKVIIITKQKDNT